MNSMRGVADLTDCVSGCVTKPRGIHEPLYHRSSSNVVNDYAILMGLAMTMTMRGSNSKLPHTTETGCRWLYGQVLHIAQPDPNLNVYFPGTILNKISQLSLNLDIVEVEGTRKSEARVGTRLHKRVLVAGARCRNGPLLPLGALITRGGCGVCEHDVR